MKKKDFDKAIEKNKGKTVTARYICKDFPHHNFEKEAMYGGIINYTSHIEGSEHRGYLFITSVKEYPHGDLEIKGLVGKTKEENGELLFMDYRNEEGKNYFCALDYCDTIPNVHRKYNRNDLKKVLKLWKNRVI